MNENNQDNKKNKELDSNTKERNLQEYNSNDTKLEVPNGQNPPQKHQGQQHTHDDNCGCQ